MRQRFGRHSRHLILATGGCSVHWLARPHLFSFLFFTLALHITQTGLRGAGQRLLALAHSPDTGLDQPPRRLLRGLSGSGLLYRRGPAECPDRARPRRPAAAISVANHLRGSITAFAACLAMIHVHQSHTAGSCHKAPTRLYRRSQQPAATCCGVFRGWISTPVRSVLLPAAHDPRLHGLRPSGAARRNAALRRMRFSPSAGCIWL